MLRSTGRPPSRESLCCPADCHRSWRTLRDCLWIPGPLEHLVALQTLLGRTAWARAGVWPGGPGVVLGKPAVDEEEDVRHVLVKRGLLRRVGRKVEGVGLDGGEGGLCLRGHAWLVGMDRPSGAYEGRKFASPDLARRN
jgi:hypothetical protein